MMNYAGREEYAECLIGAAGVTCWICKKNKRLSDEICHNSKWLAEFVEVAMEVDETTGMVVWKKRLTEMRGIGCYGFFKIRGIVLRQVLS